METEKRVKKIGVSKLSARREPTESWGALTKKEVDVMREFLQRFIEICPDADNVIDPADRKRIAKVKKILGVMTGA